MKAIKEQLAGRRYGELITRVEGVVESVYNRREGVAKRKKDGKEFNWSNQDGMLATNDDSIKIKFKDLHHCAKNLRGKKLVFESVKTEHGFRGCKFEKEEFDTKAGEHVVNPVLIVTGACKITGEGGYRVYAGGETQTKGGDTVNGNYKKTTYTKEDLLDLYNWFKDEGADDYAATKLMATASVHGLKATDEPKPEDHAKEALKARAADDGPSFTDEDIPF